VADRDRQNGKLLLRKAEAAQKKGAWTEVAQLAADGLALDPTNWELEALSLQAGWRLGALPGLKAATRLAELGPKRGEIRANLLAEAGEILIKEGRPGEAMAQFQAAVAAFPEHIGARRRLRLHEQRTAPPPAPPPSALDSLKGLFRKGEAAPAPPVPPALPPKPR
jgi:tetratricopeptide (TPR) repeat protein